jgi:ABC-2 type transport system permease protein
VSAGVATTPAKPTQGEASFANVVRSEWTKLISVRSTVWTMVLTVGLTVGFGLLISWAVEANYGTPGQGNDPIDATAVSLVGISFGQLAIAVLGVMVISTEYSTGGIRTSLTAVPRRLRLLGAKALVLVVVSLVAGTIACFISFFLGQLLLAKVGIEAHLGDPQVLRAVFGGGLYLAGSAMFGLALGALLRHTAAGITLVVGALLVVPPFTHLLPSHWGHAVARFFTSNAGGQIFTVRQDSDLLSPWNGYLVFTAWWLVILAVAAWLMQRRDA